jgi:hypothetical protein
MKSGTPRQSPDLRTTPDQLSDRERELLSQRVKILEQRLLILKKYDRSTQQKPNGRARQKAATGVDDGDGFRLALVTTGKKGWGGS